MIEFTVGAVIGIVFGCIVCEVINQRYIWLKLKDGTTIHVRDGKFAYIIDERFITALDQILAKQRGLYLNKR